MEAMCNMNMKNTCPMMPCPMMFMQPMNLNNAMAANPSFMNNMYMNNYAAFNPVISRNYMKNQYPSYNTNYISSPNLFYMEMKPVSIEDIKD